MSFLLFYTKLFLILIASNNISKKFNKNFLITNFLLISIYIFILFYFSFFNLFNYINIVIIFFLIINFFFIRNIFYDTNLKFIFLILMTILVSHFFLQYGFLFWDEFTQWGIKPKEIFLNKSIFYSYVTTNNKYWLISIFYNFLMFEQNQYNENLVILSQLFLNICALMFIFSFIKQNLKNFFLILTFFYFTTYIFNYGFYTIYPDIIVGLYFLALYLYIVNTDLKNWFDVLVVSVLLALLCLIKGISFFFSFLIFLNLIIFLFKKKIDIKIFVKILLIVLAIFFSYQIIIYYNKFGYHINPKLEKYISKLNYEFLNKYFVKSMFDKNIYEGKFFNLFFKISQYFKINLNSLNYINFKLNYFFWVIFCFVLMIVNFWISKEKQKIMFSCIVIFLSLIFYTIFIAYSYKHYFGPTETISMSSFGRYFGIFFFFWLFINFIYLINNSNNSILASVLKYFLLFFLFVSAPGKAYENLITPIMTIHSSYQNKILIKKRDIFNITKNIEKDKKIYFIDQNSDEFLLRVARYIVYPLKSNDNCSSLVVDIKDKEEYDCVISKKNFNLILKDYDYLVFLNNNLNIIKTYDINNKVKLINTINEISLYSIN